MYKDPSYTPDSKLQSWIRRYVWLRSRERSFAEKRDGVTCVKCKRKRSAAKGKEVKVDVHHKRGGINWKPIYEAIRAELLVNPEELECLCRDCHNQTTYGH